MQATKQPSISNEIEKASQEATKEAQLLGELVCGIETQLDTMLGAEPPATSTTDGPEAVPANDLATIHLVIRQIRSCRSRLEACSNRL